MSRVSSAKGVGRRETHDEGMFVRDVEQRRRSSECYARLWQSMCRLQGAVVATDRRGRSQAQIAERFDGNVARSDVVYEGLQRRDVYSAPNVVLVIVRIMLGAMAITNRYAGYWQSDYVVINVCFLITKARWQVAACHRLENHFVMWIDVLVCRCYAMNQWMRTVRRARATAMSEEAACASIASSTCGAGTCKRVARHRRVSLLNWSTLFVIMCNVELLSLYDDGRGGSRVSSGVERAQSQNDEQQRGRLSVRRVCVALFDLLRHWRRCWSNGSPLKVSSAE